ncbi:MAG: L,D-transpeptidase family protein [Elusimicrobia bacterium]|nr:L,D-transpeptidase family protein [Elusimicrobiota bacterium]
MPSPFRAGAALCLLSAGCGPAWRRPLPAPIPESTRQLVVAVAPEAKGPRGVVRLFSRAGNGWRPESGPWPAALGERGVAWGIGQHPPQGRPRKREGDLRSPAGRFRIGTIYGNFPELPAGAKGWPYVQKTERDAWIDDPKLPGYNHFVRVPEGRPLPDWFASQKMSLDTPVLEWLVHIEHNYPDAIPGRGSALFMHKWHGENDATSGCVALPPEKLEELMRWLDPVRKAQLVLLSRKDYRRLWRAWDLPAPDVLEIPDP